MYGPLVNNVEAVWQSGQINSEQVYLYGAISSSIALLSMADTTALSRDDYFSPTKCVVCRNLEIFVGQEDGNHYKKNGNLLFV